MLDRNSDEVWAEFLVQEERNAGESLGSSLLEPIKANIDDIAVLPVGYIENGISGRRMKKSRRWTEEEDRMILNLYKEKGAKWKLMSSQLQGRAPDSIKSRFYGTLRKQNVLRKRTLAIYCEKKGKVECSESEQEDILSSTSTDPIECPYHHSNDSHLSTEEKRRKVQELYAKVRDLQSVILKTQMEINFLQQL